MMSPPNLSELRDAMLRRERDRKRYWADVDVARAKVREKNHKRWDKNPDAEREKSRVSQAKMRAADPERFRQKQSAWKKANPDAARKHSRTAYLKRAYKITQEEFDALFEAQGRKCALELCGAIEPKGKGWHIDHCHETGRVRGILCHHCNIGIGNLRDNAALLRAAADYLER